MNVVYAYYTYMSMKKWTELSWCHDEAGVSTERLDKSPMVPSESP